MSISNKKALFSRWKNILFKKNRVSIRQAEGKLYSKKEVCGYYNDLTGKVNKNTMLDSDGIPINQIEGNKIVYFPISIFQYALGLWDLYFVSKSDEHSRHFLKLCEWIVNNQQEDGSWNCFQPIGYKEIKYSSMGQGEAISVLLRAFVLTRKPIYVDRAKKAINFMIKPIQQGGTLFVDENDNYIFEEYAHINSNKKSVLNGWIFSLFGLFDYLIIFGDSNVRAIFQKSIASLKKLLPLYDRKKYWTNYDLSGRIASPAYHDLHICLLRTLSDVCDDSFFLEWANKWEKYERRKTNKFKAIVKKAFQKLKDNDEGVLIK